MTAEPLTAAELDAVEAAGAAWCSEALFARLCAAVRQAEVRADAAEQRVAALETALADVLWILRHGEIAGAEQMAWLHGFRYSDAFVAACTRRREAAEALLAAAPTGEEAHPDG